MADARAGRGRGLRRERRLARLGLALAVALSSAPSLAARAPQAEAARAAQREAHALAQEGEVGAAAERLVAALDELELELAPLARASLGVQLAEYERYLRRWRAGLDALARAEALLGSDLAARQLACHVHGVRGQTYLDWGLVDLATHAFEAERQALAELVAAGREPVEERVNAELHRAHLALALDDVDLLERRVEDARLRSPWTELPGERAKLEVRLGIGLVEAERADPARPRRAHAVLARALAEPALAEPERLRPELLLAELALEQGDHARAAELLAAVEQRIARSDDARDTPEFARFAVSSARFALARGAPHAELARWRDTLAEAFEAFLARWADVEPRPGGHGFFHYGGEQEIVGELVRLSLALDPTPRGTSAALGWLVRAQALGRVSRALGARPDRSPADLVSELVRELVPRPDTGLVVWLPAYPSSHAFALDGGGIAHFELAGAERLARARAALVRTLHAPSAALGDEDARARHARERERARAELADLLFPPALAARVLGWSEISLSGLDVPGELPVECLTLGDGPELGRARAVTSLPSLPVGLALARAARSATDAEQHAEPGGAALLGAPRAADELGERWPETQEPVLEAHAARELVAPFGARARTWLGEQATRERLGDAELGALDVLVVFTHGVHAAERERPIGLVLAPSAGDPSGLLWAEDVERLRAPPCVVLAACRGGHGPLRRGDPGAADLGGAFLVAGARDVVVSAFDLEPEATRRLSRTLLAELARGVSTAEALRRARVELAQDERFADPFYLATWRVIGLGHRAPVAAPFDAAETGRDATADDGAGRRRLAVALALGVPLVLFALRARRRPTARSSR